MRIPAKYKIPRGFNFKIHRAEENGYWLDSKDLPGLYTQGDTLAELFENLEDAVLTYFDVPRKESRKMLGFINIGVRGLVELPGIGLRQPALAK